MLGKMLIHNHLLQDSDWYGLLGIHTVHFYDTNSAGQFNKTISTVADI